MFYSLLTLTCIHPDIHFDPIQFSIYFRFLAMQKLAEEKKAEALKQMSGMPQVDLDLKRHGPDGYHGCRDGRGLPGNTTMPRQHPKQVGEASPQSNLNSTNK